MHRGRAERSQRKDGYSRGWENAGERMGELGKGWVTTHNWEDLDRGG